MKIVKPFECENFKNASKFGGQGMTFWGYLHLYFMLIEVSQESGGESLQDWIWQQTRRGWCASHYSHGLIHGMLKSIYWPPSLLPLQSKSIIDKSRGSLRLEVSPAGHPETPTWRSRVMLLCLWVAALLLLPSFELLLLQSSWLLFGMVRYCRVDPRRAK